MALTTIEEIEVATGAVITDEAKAQFIINTVSSFIESYTGKKFTLQESQSLRLRADGWGIIEFPDLTDVENVFHFGTTTSTADWEWDGLDRIWGLEAYQVVDVVISYGWPSIPDDIKSVATLLSASALGIPLEGTFGALESIRVGDVQETYASTSESGELNFTIGGLALQILDSYKEEQWTLRTAIPEPPPDNNLPTL